MDYSFLIACLRQKLYIADLDRDILSTWAELRKVPLDQKSAQE